MYVTYCIYWLPFLTQDTNISLVFTPTVRTLLPEDLSYPVRYHIKFVNPASTSINNKEYFIKVSAFRTKFSVSQLSYSILQLEIR